MLDWLRTSAMRTGSSPSAIAWSMAGRIMAAPMLIDEATLQRLRRAHPARAAAPAAQSRGHRGGASRPSRERRRSPASTRPSIAAIRSSPTRSRCRGRYYDEGVRRYGFHGLSYEYITRALSQDRARRSRARTSSSPISATAPRCARSRTAARWPRPWVSPRSMVCRWARAAASSTPACCFI